jgi:hypothetical protein
LLRTIDSPPNPSVPCHALLRAGRWVLLTVFHGKLLGPSSFELIAAVGNRVTPNGS